MGVRFSVDTLFCTGGPGCSAYKVSSIKELRLSIQLEIPDLSIELGINSIMD